MSAPASQPLFMVTPSGFAGAQVAKASDQTGGNYLTRAAIAWDATHFDAYNFHSSGANTRLTIPSAFNGQYVVIMASVVLQNVSASSTADICIAKNGSITFDGTSGFKSATGGGSSGAEGVNSQLFLQCRTPPIQVSTGDYFEAMLFNDVDAGMDIIAAQSSFAIYVIGSSVMGCLLKNTSDLTAQNFNGSLIPTWAAEVYDTDGFHDTSANQSRITIPSAANGRYGIFKINLRLSLIQNSTNLSAAVLKNGADFLGNGLQLSRTDGSSLAYGWVEVESQPVLLATNDYHQVSVFTNDTSTTLDAAGSSFSLEVLPVSFRGVLAKLNADQTTANYSTPTAIAWNGTDVYDTDALHDPASNNTKIIIPAGLNGKYAILNAVPYTSLVASSSQNSIGIQKGGSNNYNGFGGRGGSNGTFANGTLQGRTQIVLLATGDEFTSRLYMSDTSVTLLAATSTFGLRILDYA